MAWMQDASGQWWDDGSGDGSVPPSGYEDGSQQFLTWLDSYGGGDPSSTPNGTLPSTDLSGNGMSFWDFYNMLDSSSLDTSGFQAPGVVGGSNSPSDMQVGSSFWDRLGNFLSGGNSGTGSGSGASASQRAAQTAGTAAQSAAQGRLAEAYYLTNRDRNALDFYKTKVNTPNALASQAVKGSLLQNASDSYTEHPRASVVHFGGAKPSMLTPEARSLGSSMVSNAAANQQALGTTPMPSMSPEPQAGFWETANSGVANGLGAASSVWDLIQSLMGKG